MQQLYLIFLQLGNIINNIQEISLKNCPDSFKHHKAQRPHPEYLWEFQSREQQTQLAQLTKP